MLLRLCLCVYSCVFLFLVADVSTCLEEINNSPNSPWRKYGTCFGENNKGVHTYFGCGGNTTCIHTDPSENLLLVVMGEKFLDIYPPCDAACALSRDE